MEAQSPGVFAEPFCDVLDVEMFLLVEHNPTTNSVVGFPLIFEGGFDVEGFIDFFLLRFADDSAVRVIII